MRYISGDDVDVVDFYDKVEAILSIGSANKLAADWQAEMLDVLECVEGDSSVKMIKAFFCNAMDLVCRRNGERKIEADLPRTAVKGAVSCETQY